MQLPKNPYHGKRAQTYLPARMHFGKSRFPDSPFLGTDTGSDIPGSSHMGLRGGKFPVPREILALDRLCLRFITKRRPRLGFETGRRRAEHPGGRSHETQVT